jgi:hypothetical protein
MDRLRQPVHLAIRYCANFAESLGDDEIGAELTDLTGIDGNYRAVSLPEAVHLRIDRSARGPWINRRARNPGKSLD